MACYTQDFFFQDLLRITLLFQNNVLLWLFPPETIYMILLLTLLTEAYQDPMIRIFYLASKVRLILEYIQYLPLGCLTSTFDYNIY